MLTEFTVGLMKQLHNIGDSEMKECKDCEYFEEGYDSSDGTPYCSHDGGYEYCPYNCQGTVNRDELKITLDMPEIADFIKHTVQNTVHTSVYQMIEVQVKKIVDSDIKELTKKYVEESLRKCIDDEIKSYMGKEITIGGGWHEPERKMSREAYLSECVSNSLEEKLKPEQIKRIVTDYCSKTISDRLNNLKYDINTGIKNKFDEETRKTLSDNVVSMLMAGDTYKKLSDSMGRLLE